MECFECKWNGTSERLLNLNKFSCLLADICPGWRCKSALMRKEYKCIHVSNLQQVTLQNKHI